MRTLTPRIAAELLQHEGVAREAYRDSQGIWTWGVGITDASGHRIERYRDDPQPLERCLAIYLWVLTHRYLPAVIAAFGEHDPTEHELGAALSFHYNTGAILRAAWLRRFLAGQPEAARAAFLEWSRPAAIVPRRRRERDLFFDARWSGDGRCLVYEVAKPSYQPVRGRRLEVMPLLESLMPGGAGAAPAAAAPQALAAAPPADREAWFDRLYE